MIRVLIVDDSVTQREILARIIREDDGFNVVGEARNGLEAIELIQKLSPDVVLMDVHMDKMNGIEATERIMRENPVPIVIMSSTLQQREINLAVEALRVGAVLAIEKPKGSALLHLPKIGPSLLQMLRDAALTRVRRMSAQVVKKAPVRIGRYQPPDNVVDVIGICSSAGGPSTLLEIFSALPKSFPIPLLLVQHISAGFEAGFANWLTEHTDQTARIATSNQRLTPGIWLGPRDHHLVLKTPHQIALVPRKAEDIHCPAGNPLLHSLAQQHGPKAVGVVITGMGDDGAQGLLALKRAGGQTIIQNEATAMVWGMPAAAKKLGAADYEMSPAEIADALCQIGKRIKM